MKKLNCWEFMKCGREPGGKHADELGVCPAATNERYDGIQGGRNAGRVCWVVVGTMCGGEVTGTFAKKYLDCRKCEFYKKAREEESLLHRMYKKDRDETS
ncbi:MAG: two-CW domain-containing protein [bacterium]